MKIFGIVKYIMNLRERDRIIAMLLIMVGSLYSQNSVHGYKMVEMGEKYQQALLKMSDACDAQKIKILNDDIKAIHQARTLVDSLASVNLKIIIQNNQNASPPKLLP